jgi:peptide/nickel transport system substrate-binding protein
VGQILVVALLLGLSGDVGGLSRASELGSEEASVTGSGVVSAEITVTPEGVRWTDEGTITVASQVYLPAVDKGFGRDGTLNLTSLDDAHTLNPYIARDEASQEVMGYLFERAFETDPWTGELVPGLVESWIVASGNLTVTYLVRHGANWSDGEPITARDYKFMFDALMAKDGEGNAALSMSPWLDLVEGVETVELLGDYALRVTYSEPYCDNVGKLNLPWWPSHVFMDDPAFAFADLAHHPFGDTPTVASGPFLFDEWVRHDHITLVRNTGYWRGAPYLDGISWQVVADPAAGRARMAAGSVDLIAVEPEYLGEMEQLTSVTIHKFLRTDYDYIGLQQGDPANPQPRLNGDGSVNENHGLHPILSKKEVRQALVYATDRTTIIEQARLGQAEPLHAQVVPPYSWAYNDALVPRDYDPATAAAMLEAAGWTLNAATGIRECQGCGTAPDGTPMHLTLTTNAGNPVRETIVQLVQQQWSQVGVDVDAEAIEWNAFLDMVLGQTFDAVVVGWTGVDADNETLFSAKYDVPNGGFNFCSSYRPDYEALETEAKTVSGCSYAERGAIYRQTQEILYDEQPYVWLYTPYEIHVFNDRIGGIQPGPWDPMHDIHRWYVKP